MGDTLCVKYIINKPAVTLWNLTVDFQSDSDSFNPTLWEEQRQQRMTVAFEFEDKKEDDENAGKVKVNLLAFVSLFFPYALGESRAIIQIDFALRISCAGRSGPSGLLAPFWAAGW